MIKIKEFIEKEKTKYYQIKKIRSVIFLNQEIIFNKTGFNHLIKKGKYRRSTSEKVRRFGLLIYIERILQDYHVEVEYRYMENNGNKTHFWGITKTIRDDKIKVIIYKVNNGKLTFLSIMNYGKGK